MHDGDHGAAAEVAFKITQPEGRCEAGPTELIDDIVLATRWRQLIERPALRALQAHPRSSMVLDMESRATVGVLLGGLGLCGAACVLAPYSGSSAFALLAASSLSAVGRAIAPELASDLFVRFANWTGSKARDAGAAAENHDLRELLVVAMENVLDEARKNFRGPAGVRAYMLVLRKNIRGHLPSVMADHRFRGIGEADLVAFFKPRLDEFSTVRALTPALWVDLLNEITYDELNADQLTALNVGAEALHSNLPKHLVGVYRDALQHHPTVFVAVQSAILQELWHVLSRIGPKIDANSRAAETMHARLLQEIADLRDEVRRAFPDEYDDAIAELRVLGWTTEWLARDTRELVKSIARGTEAIPKYRPLGPMLERPWKRPRTLPFHFSLEDVPLHGEFAHKDLPAQVAGFLDRPDFALWWLWTGLEGAGKSRLALEACRQAEGAGWDAGFLPLDDLRELKSRWNEVGLRRGTLVVCDYAGLDTPAVRAALVALAQHSGEMIARRGGHKLRILLLERHSNAVVPTSPADLPPQWCVDLFQSHRAGTAFLGNQHPEPDAPSLHIGELPASEARPLALECVRGARAKIARSGAPAAPGSLGDEQLAGRVLEILQAAGRTSQLRPLHIQVTAFVLAALSRSAGTFEEIIAAYLRYRVELRRHDFSGISSNAADVDRMFNLVCVATILRTVDLADIPHHPHLPGEAFRVNPGRLLAHMGQPPDSTSVQGLEPDLIGEWFVRLWCGPRSVLGGRLPYPRLAEILDQIPHANAGIADFVQRTYRYPEFRDRGLWKRLRSRLGRYSTPFGRLFDSREKQQALLGGRTKEAEHCYSTAIADAVRASVRSAGSATLVDLMAGGSERCAELLGEHPDLRIIAVDRDVSRLKPLEVRFPKRILAVHREIEGRIGLRDLLRRFNGGNPSDIVIAKKALHELPWRHQAALIREIGDCLLPGDGRCILYTDSPEFIDEAGRMRLARLLAAVRRDELGTAVDQYSEWIESDAATEQELAFEQASEDRIQGLMLEQEFRPESRADAAVFANMWVALKDWANYNLHECVHRYFSSVNELALAFREAGLSPSGPQGGVHRFHMTLQAARFVEDAINRIGYMCSDSTVTDDQLRSAFSANPRLAVFRRVVEHHLWAGNGPTAFGRSPYINARPGEVFDLDNFVRGMNSRLDGIDFEGITGPTFDMPVHVLCLSRHGK